MDIQEMKKVNELSKELQRHGIAKTSEDGAEIAENMVDKEGVIPKPEKVNASEKYEILLERVSRKFSSEFENVKGEMRNIVRQLEELRKSVNEVEKSPLIAEKISEEETTPEVQEKLKTEKKEENPRQGEYNSEDVAVDKIFYCGQK